VGDLMARPRAPLAARFGSGTLLRLDQALGLEDEPLTPRLPVAPYSVEQGFPEPLSRDEDLLAVLAHLVRRLCVLLETRGEGARALVASFFGVDGTVRRLTLGTSRALRDPAALDRLFGENFARQSWPDSFGFDRIRLSATATEALAPAQAHWDAGEEDMGGLASLCDRLAARLGAHRVLGFMDQDSHVPEEASIAVPVQSAAEFSRKLAPPQQDSLVPPRPVRLFARPEPIETIAETPDGPPVRFRWRRVLHDVRRAEGPERIALPWWIADAKDGATRDYFRVEATDGTRLWLYREGIYQRETARPRWFLHGFLA
jgi:protein ImuB